MVAQFLLLDSVWLVQGWCDEKHNVLDSNSTSKTWPDDVAEKCHRKAWLKGVVVNMRAGIKDVNSVGSLSCHHGALAFT